MHTGAERVWVHLGGVGVIGRDEPCCCWARIRWVCEGVLAVCNRTSNDRTNHVDIFVYLFIYLFVCLFFILFFFFFFSHLLGIDPTPHSPCVRTGPEEIPSVPQRPGHIFEESLETRFLFVKVMYRKHTGYRVKGATATTRMGAETHVLVGHGIWVWVWVWVWV